MVPPYILCRNHLLGEHSEIHKHRHNFVKGHSIKGRIEGNAVEPMSMESRHDALVEEMLRRGYNHQSPYEQPSLEHYSEEEMWTIVDTEAALEMLLERCPECRARYEGDVYDTERVHNATSGPRRA